MTGATWAYQKSRLVDRFGERNFSKEFSLLVALECKPMPDDEFVTMVNNMIGSKRPNDPPLIRDFREARFAWERRKFEGDLAGAERAMNWPAKGGLKLYLAKEFPGCKSLNDAVQVRRLQIQIQTADNPTYDPMTDRKWMGRDAWDPKGPA